VQVKQQAAIQEQDQEEERMSRNGGRGRGYHRGGRASGRSGRFNSQRNTNRNQSSMSTDKPKELKFHPQSVGKTHVASYATTKDAIEQKIQSEWKQGGYDIAKSLLVRGLEMTPIEDDRPERELSELQVDKGKAKEQSGMDICYQEKLRRYLDRVQTLKDGMNQAYSLIFSTYCSKLMQGRLEALPKFKQSIRNNPIELLKAIKNCMVESVRAQFPLISMTDSLIRLVNIQDVRPRVAS